jgi:hypothetical protein
MRRARFCAGCASSSSSRAPPRWLAEGEARGEAKGEVRGEARGKAEAVLAILAARGLAVSEAQRARILATAELAELDRLIQRAAVASSVEEVLD